VPAPIGDRPAQTVTQTIHVDEVDGLVAEGTSYRYWTFDGKVPGPLLRVRVGDTVELTLDNPATNTLSHNIDLHAVNGPGGGAVGTNVAPGETKTFTFQALNPGVYIYHCATAPVPAHISNGMYGLIIVEPDGGLPPVDKEYYVVQGELYTAQPTGTQGQLTYDAAAVDAEAPTYVVFNGAYQALTGDNALTAEVGDRVRIFVGNGGPDLISSFHVIGEIFDEVHPEGSTEPATNVQTTLIPAGGAAWVEFTVDVPGTYVLVDHALSRTFDKGSLGHLVVTGPANPDVFDAPDAEPDATHGG
jgi:nitrite reductase (NO-forming)